MAWRSSRRPLLDGEFDPSAGISGFTTPEPIEVILIPIAPPEVMISEPEPGVIQVIPTPIMAPVTIYTPPVVIPDEPTPEPIDWWRELEEEPVTYEPLPIIEPTPQPPATTFYRDVFINYNPYTGDFNFEFDFGDPVQDTWTWPTIEEAKDHIDRIIAFIGAKAEADRIREEQALEVPLIPEDIAPGPPLGPPPLDIEPFEPPVIPPPVPIPFVIPTGPVPTPPPVPPPVEVDWETVFETTTDEGDTYKGPATYEDVAYFIDPLKLLGNWRDWASFVLPMNIINKVEAGPATLLKLRVSVGKRKVLWGAAEWPVIRVESWQHGSVGIIAVIGLIVVAWAFVAWLWQKVEEIDWAPIGAAVGTGIGLLILAALVMQGGNNR